MADKRIENLDKSHPDIILNLEKYSRAANIMPKFILNSMTPYIADDEPNLYKNFQKIMQEKSGVAYIGFKDTDIHSKFCAIAGFFVRNYVNARIIMSGQISMKGEDTRCLDCRVMLVPDLFLQYKDAGNIPSWRLSDLLSVLYYRASHNRPTIVYIQDWNSFTNIYGKLFKEHIETYVKVDT